LPLDDCASPKCGNAAQAPVGRLRLQPFGKKPFGKKPSQSTVGTRDP
jgi:hypothetical protein